MALRNVVGGLGSRRFVVGVGMLLAGMAMSPSAQAGPWEVGGLSPDTFYKLKFEFAYRSSAFGRSWERPTIGFAAPLNERLSYEVASGYGVAGDRDGMERGGVRDLNLKLKWQVAAAHGNRPAVMFEPSLTLPTGDEASGVGSNRTTLKMPLRAGWQVGKLIWTAETVYTHAFGHGSDDLLGYGVLLEYVISPEWLVGMDLFNDRPVNNADGYHLRSHAAVKWKPGRHVEWHALVGRSLENRRGAATNIYKFAFEYKF